MYHWQQGRPVAIDANSKAVRMARGLGLFGRSHTCGRDHVLFTFLAAVDDERVGHTSAGSPALGAMRIFVYFGEKTGAGAAAISEAFWPGISQLGGRSAEIGSDFIEGIPAVTSATLFLPHRIFDCRWIEDGASPFPQPYDK